MAPLSPILVHEILRRFFPAKNDDFACDYVEELGELNTFGIHNEEQLVNLLQKRVEEVMEIDRSPMDEFDVRVSIEDKGEAFVSHRLREGFWFSYPGLLRITLELEFGEAYIEFARKRDGCG